MLSRGRNQRRRRVNLLNVKHDQSHLVPQLQSSRWKALHKGCIILRSLHALQIDALLPLQATIKPHSVKTGTTHLRPPKSTISRLLVDWKTRRLRLDELLTNPKNLWETVKKLHRIPCQKNFVCPSQSRWLSLRRKSFRLRNWTTAQWKERSKWWKRNPLCLTTLKTMKLRARARKRTMMSPMKKENSWAAGSLLNVMQSS